MTAKRKQIKMVVTVSVPKDMPAAEVRREVRTLINDQRAYLDKWELEVRARSVRPL